MWTAPLPLQLPPHLLLLLAPTALTAPMAATVAPVAKGATRAMVAPSTLSARRTQGAPLMELAVLVAKVATRALDAPLKPCARRTQGAPLRLAEQPRLAAEQQPLLASPQPPPPPPAALTLTAVERVATASVQRRHFAKDELGGERACWRRRATVTIE